MDDKVKSSTAEAARIRSFIKYTAQADTSTETELLVALDFARSETVRRMWPFLRDRRIDAYDGLTRRLLD